MRGEESCVLDQMFYMENIWGTLGFVGMAHQKTAWWGSAGMPLAPGGWASQFCWEGLVLMKAVLREECLWGYALCSVPVSSAS